MAQFKTNRGGGGGRASSVASVVCMFLARELTRPRFRTILGVVLFIVLLLRQHIMPIGTTSTSTAPLTSATATTTTAAAAAAKPDNLHDTTDRSKPTVKMTSTSTTLSLMESKTNTRLYNRNNSSNTIPRTIYIFWSSGWPSDRVEGQLVRKSWEYFNSAADAGYTVHCLDFHQAELLTDRRRYVPDIIFDKMKVQARSDVYRTLIIYRYGGIWVDASLFCNMPLDDWLDLNQTDLISFVRNDKLDKQEHLDIYPWITSWFLAAPKESYILSRIVQILSNATEQEKRLNKKGDYFWWHRIVSDLARQDEYIMNRIQTLFASADPMHCKQDGYENMAPVLKRCGNNKMYSTFATAHVCCTQTPAGRHGSNTVHDSRRNIIKMAQATANLTQNPMTAAAWNDFCAGWNCTMHSRNMHRIDEFKALYGNKTFGKLPFILYSG